MHRQLMNIEDILLYCLLFTFITFISNLSFHLVSSSQDLHKTLCRQLMYIEDALLCPYNHIHHIFWLFMLNKSTFPIRYAHTTFTFICNLFMNYLCGFLRQDFVISNITQICRTSCLDPYYCMFTI